MADVDWRALATLAVLSLLCGAAMAWVFARLTRRDELDRVRCLITAHLLEFRLFGDEPALVLRAQRGVIRYSLQLLGMVLLPAAAMAVPGFFLYPVFEENFGRAPLEAGQATVVTLNRHGGGEADSTPRLTAGGALRVETPAVRTAADEWCWRVRATGAGDAEVRVSYGTARWSKPVRLRPAVLHAPERASPLSVYYDDATILGLPWPVWFALFCSAGFLWRWLRDGG